MIQLIKDIIGAIKIAYRLFKIARENYKKQKLIEEMKKKDDKLTEKNLSNMLDD
jgi:hypothetical protein